MLVADIQNEFINETLSLFNEKKNIGRSCLKFFFQ